MLCSPKPYKVLKLQLFLLWHSYYLWTSSTSTLRESGRIWLSLGCQCELQLCRRLSAV